MPAGFHLWRRRAAIIKDVDQVVSKQRAEVRVLSGHSCSLDALSRRFISFPKLRELLIPE
jgi:hypothetical protein